MHAVTSRVRVPIPWPVPGLVPLPGVGVVPSPPLMPGLVVPLLLGLGAHRVPLPLPGVLHLSVPVLEAARVLAWPTPSRRARHGVLGCRLTRGACSHDRVLCWPQQCVCGTLAW